MVNPLLSSAALWPVEFAINQLINSDQHLKSTLFKFDGKLLEINASKPAACLCITFNGNQLRLSALNAMEQNAEPSASVSGDTSVLLGLLSFSSNDNALANPNLTIKGDAGFVHDLFNGIRNLDLRWDDLLAPWFGDLATQNAKDRADDLQQWASEASRSFNSSINDFLTEESNTLPAISKAEEFSERLDQLKLRIDRSEARAARLERSLP